MFSRVLRTTAVSCKCAKCRERDFTLVVSGPPNHAFFRILLVRLGQKASTPPRLVTTRGARPTVEQGAGEPLVHRGDRGGDMAFRPHRERPAA